MTCGEASAGAAGGSVERLRGDGARAAVASASTEQQEQAWHGAPDRGYLGSDVVLRLSPGEQMNRRIVTWLSVLALVSCRSYDYESKMTDQDGLVPPDQFARYGTEQAEARRYRAGVRSRRAGQLGRRAHQAGRRGHDIRRHAAGRRRRQSRSPGTPTDHSLQERLAGRPCRRSRTARAARRRPASSRQPGAAKHSCRLRVGRSRQYIPTARATRSPACCQVTTTLPDRRSRGPGGPDAGGGALGRLRPGRRARSRAPTAGTGGSSTPRSGTVT